MGGKVKLTVTVEADLAADLDKEAKKRKISRSALVEEAICLFRDKRLADSLKQGYAAMAEENRLVAEDRLGYAVDILDEE